MQSDGEADLRDRPIGVAEQRGGTLETPRQQVLMRRLAEGAPELAAEVRRRELSRSGESRHVERLAIARVNQILRPEQVPRGRLDRQHAPSISQSDIWAIRK